MSSNIEKARKIIRKTLVEIREEFMLREAEKTLNSSEKHKEEELVATK